MSTNLRREIGQKWSPLTVLDSRDGCLSDSKAGGDCPLGSRRPLYFLSQFFANRRMSEPTMQIVRHRLQVIWIYASRILTTVVNIHVWLKPSVRFFVEDTVGFLFAKHGVSVVESSSPHPAFGFVSEANNIEAGRFFERHLMPIDEIKRFALDPSVSGVGGNGKTRFLPASTFAQSAGIGHWPKVTTNNGGGLCQ